MSDLLAQTGYLEWTGLAFVSGNPMSTVLFLVFFATSFLAIAWSLLRANVRADVFGVPALPLGSVPVPGGFLNKIRRAVPLDRMESAVVLALNVAILGLRFVRFPWPQGSDTPQYLAASNWILIEGDYGQLSPASGLGAGRSLAVALFAGLQAFLGLISPDPEMVTPIVVPILLGVLYSFANARLVLVLTQNSRLAFWAAILAPASFMTIRMSYDLFAQFLGQSIMILALASFLRYLLPTAGSMSGMKKTGWVASGLFVAGFLAHLWTWAVMVIVSMGIGLWVLFANRTAWKPTLFRGLTALAPSFALMGILVVAIPSVTTTAFYAYSVGDARLFNLESGWYWSGGWDSAFVWLFCIGALLSLVGTRSEPTLRAPLMIWALTVSALVLTIGYRDSYRLIVLYPAPILVVLGVRSLVRRLTPKTGNLSHSPATAARLAAIGLTVLVVAGVIPSTYIPTYRYWVGEDGYVQLHQIREGYGFAPAGVVLLVDRSNFESGFRWSEAITGAQVYPGSLLGLLRGDPFRIDDHRWISPSPGGTVFLLPDTLYMPDGFERGLLSPSQIPGVSVYETAQGYDPAEFLANGSLPLATSFWEGWSTNSSDLAHSFSNDSSGLGWSFPGQGPVSQARSSTFERSVPDSPFASLYLLAAGELGRVIGEIRLSYKDGSATTYILDRILPTPMLLRIALDRQSMPDEIVVKFEAPSGVATLEGWFRVDFMAVVPA